ncbi:hypothetical protein WN943_027207 [Citrus x changshan-huyou]
MTNNILGDVMCSRSPHIILVEVTNNILVEIINQGLRESGIYASVIASANTMLSKEKILSSVESRNNTRESKSVNSSRKIGGFGQSQATARRVLEFIDDANYTLAIPPESPPGPDDLNIDT